MESFDGGIKMNKKALFGLLILTVFLVSGQSCIDTTESTSGIERKTVEVPKGADGLTIEQRNIRDRLLEDNKIGSVKHLYIISAYSGQFILYSTVRGKVTSSGKRLAPFEVNQYNGFDFDIGSSSYETNEVLQDDGSYGSSNDYIFWWDSKGIFHQHFISGGQIVHVSSEPLNVKDIIINVELV